jgi:hypothetical protein
MKLISDVLNRKHFIDFSNYMKFKAVQKNRNRYNPANNKKKYLVIMACHCNSNIKLQAIRGNLKYFSLGSIDIIVINSTKLPYNKKVSQICKRYSNVKYHEVENSKFLDFGKWVYTLQNLVNYKLYDHVVLTNDSYIIHKPINHFFNLMYKHNVELFGYNDSTQVRYHYQSYLFGLRKDAIPKFIHKVKNPTMPIRNPYDVVLNYEVNMTDWFLTKKTFLKIGESALDRGHNIFFTNDKLYVPLKNSGLLPFTKIKRIT